jgi:hypothetical protein
MWFYNGLNSVRAFGFLFGLVSAILLATLVFEIVWLSITERTVLWVFAVTTSMSITFGLTKISPVQLVYLLLPIIGIFLISLGLYMRVASSQKDADWTEISDLLYERRINLDIIWAVLFLTWITVKALGATSILHTYYA